MNKNNLTTREWFFLIAIIMLMEYLLFFWTTSFGSDKNLTDHISFAGTIVSIILAIVAIFYSFLQSENQQRGNQNIAEQIGSLKDVVGKIDTSKIALSQEVDRFQNITNQLELMRAGVNKVHDTMNQLSEKIPKLLQTDPVSTSNDVEPSNDSKTLSPENIHSILKSSRASYILGYVLYKSHGLNLGVNQIVGNIYAKSLLIKKKPENLSGDSENSNESKDIELGISAGYALGLISVLRAYKAIDYSSLELMVIPDAAYKILDDFYKDTSLKSFNNQYVSERKKAVDKIIEKLSESE